MGGRQAVPFARFPDACRQRAERSPAEKWPHRVGWRFRHRRCGQQDVTRAVAGSLRCSLHAPLRSRLTGAAPMAGRLPRPMTSPVIGRFRILGDAFDRLFWVDTGRLIPAKG
jgi:hypothetical protein